ncbi:MAG: transcriptional regulator [Candidatus Phlomobacter fragariae]
MNNYVDCDTPPAKSMIFTIPLNKPLHRLIMMHIFYAGSLNGQEERVIPHEDFCSFCCCSRIALFKELRVLERSGFLKIRKIVEITEAAKLKTKPMRGYTILAPSLD